MGRPIGVFEFGSNYEVKTQDPLDARTKVTLTSDLIKASTWPHDGDIYYVYNGMIVSVEAEKALYMYIGATNNASDIEEISNWKKIEFSKKDLDKFGGYTQITSERPIVDGIVTDANVEKASISLTSVSPDEGVYWVTNKEIFAYKVKDSQSEGSYKFYNNWTCPQRKSHLYRDNNTLEPIPNIFKYKDTYYVIDTAETLGLDGFKITKTFNKLDLSTGGDGKTPVESVNGETGIVILDSSKINRVGTEKNIEGVLSDYEYNVNSYNVSAGVHGGQPHTLEEAVQLVNGLVRENQMKNTGFRLIFTDSITRKSVTYIYQGERTNIADFANPEKWELLSGGKEKILASDVIVSEEYGAITTQADVNETTSEIIGKIRASNLEKEEKTNGIDITLNIGTGGPSTVTIPVQSGPNAGLISEQQATDIDDVVTAVGDISELQTSAKDNLVHAINEVKNTSGSGGQGEIDRPTTETSMGYKIVNTDKSSCTLSILNLKNNLIKHSFIQSSFSVGNIGNFETITNSTSYIWSCAKIDCKPNDLFFITAKGGIIPRLYCFIDISNKVLEVAESVEDVSAKFIKAPENAVKLIVNFNNTKYVKFDKIIINNPTKLFNPQNLFLNENTIYEIRNEINLEGNNIKLPKNSIIKFNGGNFINGIITGDNSKICYNYNYHFFKDTYLNGTWDFVENIYPEWFGAVSAKLTAEYISGEINEVSTLNDSTNAINHAIILSQKNKSVCVLNGGYYKTTDTIFIGTDTTLILEKNSTIVPHMNGSGKILGQKIYALNFDKYIPTDEMAIAVRYSTFNSKIIGGGCINLIKSSYTIGLYAWCEQYYLTDMVSFPTLDIKILGGCDSNKISANVDTIIGNTVPSDSLGKNKDTYLNTSVMEMYDKEEDKWIKRKNSADCKYNVCFRSEANGENTQSEQRAVNTRYKLGIMFSWRGLELYATSPAWQNSIKYEGTISNCTSSYLSIFSGPGYLDFSNMNFQIGGNMNKDAKIIYSKASAEGVFGHTWDLEFNANDRSYPRYYFGEKSKNNIINVWSDNTFYYTDLGTNNCWLSRDKKVNVFNQFNEIGKVNLVKYRTYPNSVAPKCWEGNNSISINRYKDNIDFITMASNYKPTDISSEGFIKIPNLFFDNDLNTYYDLLDNNYKSCIFNIFNTNIIPERIIGTNGIWYLILDYSIYDKKEKKVDPKGKVDITYGKVLKSVGQVSETITPYIKYKSVLKNKDLSKGNESIIILNGGRPELLGLSLDTNNNPNIVFRLNRIRIFVDESNLNSSEDYEYIKNNISGKSEDRPNAAPNGFKFFDTTLGKEIINIGTSSEINWIPIDNTPLINKGTQDLTLTIKPNIYYKWDEISDLNITLNSSLSNTVEEYTFEFISGETPTNLKISPSIKWIGDSVIKKNTIYQISILNNIGIIVGVNKV